MVSELWLYIHRTYFDANLPECVYVCMYIPNTALNDSKSVTANLKVADLDRRIVLR